MAVALDVSHDGLGRVDGDGEADAGALLDVLVGVGGDERC